MKKYTIVLADGKRITIWAKNACDAVVKADDMYPSCHIISVNDNSPFNTPNFSKVLVDLEKENGMGLDL